MYAPVEVSPNLVPEFTATIPASESRVIFEGVRQVSGASPLTLPGNFVMPGRVRSGPRERPAYARANRDTWRSSWQLLRQRDFRIYFFGSLASNLGTWLQSTAQVLIAYQVTHSVFTVGLIASAQFAGMVLVSPWAPVLADRFSTRAVLIGTQLVSAAIAAAMAGRYFFGELGVHSLLAGAFSLGIVYALALPVQTALVPALVRKEDARDAMKMNSVSYNAGRALAPALCVPVIIFIGPKLIFLLNTISFVVFALMLRKLNHIAADVSLRATFARVVRSLRGARSDIPLQVAFGTRSGDAVNAVGETPARTSRARVRDGLMIALYHRRILLLLAIVAAVTLADDPILVLSPALAHAELHVSAEWAAYFIAALGWGSVMGSLPPAPANDKGAQKASQHAAISLLILGAAVVVFMLGISVQVSLIAAIATGAAGLFTGTAAQTALLRHHTNTAASAATVTSVMALWQSPGLAQNRSRHCSTVG